MTALLTWEENNARRLSAALNQLRQRLDQFAARFNPTSSGTAPLGELAPAEPKPDEAPQPDEESPLPWAMELLSHRLGLSTFEQNVLLLCTAMELDTRIPALCARAQDDRHKPFPTLALALALFDESAWDVVSPERPLRYFRLIEIQQTSTQPLIASPLRVDERIVSYLKGLDYLDERLAAYCSSLTLDANLLLSLKQSGLVDGLFEQLAQTADGERVPIVQLLGADGATKQLIARFASEKMGRTVYRLPAELLPVSPGELDSLARLWRRESVLLPLALYLDAQELDASAVEKIETLARFVARSDSIVFLAVREALSIPTMPVSLRVDVAKPTPEEQQSAWTEALDPEPGEAPARLAGQFNLNLPTIRELAKKAKAHSDSKATENNAWRLCCLNERPRLDALAQRIEPKVGWDDLVLPAAELSLLRQISAQIAQRRKVYGEWGFARKTSRGLGISALFSGASGTGKTMAAEVLAADLELDLYRIDLSSVVNKYIGETEKNLRRLFDAAEDGGAILFFDEADALFGKRSDVKDSHDRYANIEVNYLLQRIESYRGLAILATNLKSSMDAAFLRRLRFIVNFPVPSVADRREIWAKVFPREDQEQELTGTPVEALEYDRLARLNLTGGHIHNAALNAAFLAAKARTAVTMPLVLEAARAEFHKLNRPINSADFLWSPAGKTNDSCVKIEQAE